MESSSLLHGCVLQESKKEKLQRLGKHIKDLVDEFLLLSQDEPKILNEERVLAGLSKYSTSENKTITRYFLPKNEDFVGNIKVIAPKSCIVELHVNDKVYWHALTQPGTTKIDMTLDVNQLIGAVAEVRVYSYQDMEPDEIQVTCCCRVVKDLAERALFLTGFNKKVWFEARTPDEWK